MVTLCLCLVTFTFFFLWWRECKKCREKRDEVRHLRHLIDGLGEGVIVVSPHTEAVLYCNVTAKRLFALEKNSSLPSVGTLFTGLEPGAGDEIYQRIKEELLQGKHSIKLEFKAHQATLSLYGNTFDEDDEACVLVVQDISELKRLEQIRRDFVANVSHELKTPITSIQGSVETLLDGALEDKADARKFVEMIGRQAFRLALIFNDMLALSRIEQESDGREIERVAVDLRRLLTEGIEACRTRIEERGVEVALDCVSGLIVKVNSRLMVQALVNLIENGIKYSESGSQINVRGKEEFKTFSIEVSDQGRGIAAKHLPRLFERFYRVDESRDRKEGGTGLGLAIVKHIVQAHRGTVTVESELKVGTTFKIVLPSE